MNDVIDSWFRLAATRIHEQAPTLTALDQAIGDGDHGTNMDRGFAAIVASLDTSRSGPEAAPAEPDGDRAAAATLLRGAGKTLISTVGGAAGPLYGTALLRAGGATAAANGASSVEVALAALEAAIGGVQALGKGTTGEKTMLDALVPAAAAGRAAQAAGGDWSAVASAIASAAEDGAAATIPLVATKGRASYLGERSIGHQDPGATSAALLLRALADVAAGQP
jgi:dihydroxyacetone kinase-like protein